MMFRNVLIILVLMSCGVNADVRDEDNRNDDPLEVINRPLFAINDVLDRSVLKPVAKGYDYVLPKPAKTGVSNFFANLLDVNHFLNAVMQGELGNAGHSAGRFALNSTVGMFGLFDVATRMGIAKKRTDFGQTLAVWGVPEGPYLMVPLLGPRTLRSGVGSVFDTLTSATAQVDDVSVRNTLLFTEIISARVKLLETDQLISGDRYIFLRDAYLQQRRALISGGDVQDDFADFEDDWAEEF